jgi:hypothetical protein
MFDIAIDKEHSTGLLGQFDGGKVPGVSVRGANKGVARGFRLDAELDARLEAMAVRMSAPYHELSLAAVIRAALWEGLAVLETKFPPVRGGSRSRAPARRAPGARARKKARS